MFLRIERQETLAVAMAHRISRDHFRIKSRPFRQEPQKIAVMPIGPIHHWRYTKSMRIHGIDMAQIAQDVLKKLV